MIMDLFADQEPPPEVETKPVAADPARAPSTPLRTREYPWRPAHRPHEEPCVVCKGAAPCGIGSQWYCLNHVPPNYWPARRGE